MTTQSRYLVNRYPWLPNVVNNPAAGDVFFVNGSSGADANDGTTPETAFLTITYAINQCTAGADDYIFVYSYPGAAAGETFPIAMSASKVHLIGTQTQASPSPSIVSPADHAITVSASNCEIAGFDIGATDGTSACINVSGVTWKLHVHHNEIGWMQACQDGILYPDLVDPPHHYIHHNRFGLNVVRSGIRVTYNSTRTVIEDNYFDVASGAVGVECVGLCTGGIVIVDNKFKVTDNAAGEAITLTNANCNAYCNGNHAAAGKGAMANIPWVDGGGGNWGWNTVTAAPTACIMPA